VQLNISTRHGHLSEATQEKLRAKADKLTRFFDRLTSIEIVVDLKDSARPLVELIAAAEHSPDFVAHEQADSLMASMDLALEKIEEQLRRHKERIQSRGRDPEARRHDAPDVIADEA
jgi:putative sigma-54 modulation protein